MSLSKLDEGKRGEELACEYLKKKGFKVIDRNFRIRGGEIDIIALEKKSLVFVEVKTRTSSQFGSPFEAITSWKLRALIKTAQFYKLQHPKLPDLMRIDAVGVVMSRADNTVKIEHIENIS